MPASVKISISLPQDVLREAEQWLGRPDETRSALITRVLQDALQDLAEQEAEERYEKGYHRYPETSAECAFNRAAARALFSHDPEK
jgi:metal-responsive CopG/Arc/MetJ family transcriptional regulator